MDIEDCSVGIEIRLHTARLLIGKTMKTMQRWCDDGKIVSRVVDQRGKRIVSLDSVLPYTGLCMDHRALVQQADCGNPDAQTEVGIIFLEAQRPEIAFEWFQEAAKVHHPDAMHSLFHFYITGNMGIEKNEALGISWLAAAAAHGHVIAMAQMEALYRRG